MPYSVRKNWRGKWVVQKRGSTKILGTHDSKEEAEKQVAAIEANTHEGDG